MKMKKVTQSAKLIAACVLLSPLAHAANDSPISCVRIKEDAERLKCYDEYFDRLLAGKIEQQVSKEIAAPKPLQQVPATAPVPPAVATSSNLVAPKPPAAPAPKPSPKQQTVNVEDAFGLEKQVVEIPDSLTSVAVGDFKEWKKKMSVKLENGQVWQLTSNRTVYFKASNPKVTISKASLGSFVMQVEDLNVRFRVKRLR